MDKLIQILERIDGKGYKAFKDIKVRYCIDDIRLDIDYVQGDPFAGPSKLRVSLPLELCNIPEELLREKYIRTAVEDYIARKIAGKMSTHRKKESPEMDDRFRERRLDSSSLDPSRRKRKVKIDAPDLEIIRFGRETLDLRCVEQLADRSQSRAIDTAIWNLVKDADQHLGSTIPELLDRFGDLLDTEGLEALSLYGNKGEYPGNLARPRRHEVAAALNRLRTLIIEE